MKQFKPRMKRGFTISILMILICFALSGTIAAAAPQTSLNSYNNTTFPIVSYHNGTTLHSVGDHGYMEQGYRYPMGIRGAYQGMRGGPEMTRGMGLIHTIFIFLCVMVAVLLVLVWLAVGILLMVLLGRKLKKDKTQ
jgi:hypothetical protein